MKRFRVFLLLLIFACLTFLSACKDFPVNEYNYYDSIPFEEYLTDKTYGDEHIFNVKDYGLAEINDGITNSKAIGLAIDDAFNAGGGVILIENGVFTITTVTLKDNITLRIAKDAVLRSVSFDENKKSKEKLNASLIYAKSAENVTIQGPGRIDGNGESFHKDAKNQSYMEPMTEFKLKSYVLEFRKRIRMPKKNSGRVKLIQFEDCNNVKIENVELYQAAEWTCNILNSQNVDIKDVVINNNFHIANTDGFDISASRNVNINHCFIVTGDDGICIKTEKAGIKSRFNVDSCQNINVTNCKIMSLANCFKIGTGTYEDVNNVTVKDCQFFMDKTTGGYSGIAIESADGANVSDITVDNITMNGITSPLLIWLGSRNGTPGSINNITISNITAENVDLPSAITGVNYKGTDYKVTNVKINGFYAKYREADEKLNIKSKVSEKSMSGYPEITRISHNYFISHNLSSYYDLPVYGLYVRHYANLELNDFDVIPRNDRRPKDNI